MKFIFDKMNFNDENEIETTLQELISKDDFKIIDYIDDSIIIEYCLNHDVIDIDDYINSDETLLIHASYNGLTEMVKMLFKFRPNIELKSKRFNCTPLICASKRNHVEIIKLLLSQGANIDNPDREGTTPLMYACMGNNYNAIKLLLERGANHYIKNINGNSALIYACEMCMLNSVQLLLDYGANLNTKNKQDMTPLMCATEFCNVDVIEALLMLNMKVSDKRKALKIATRIKCKRAMKMLFESLR